MFRLSDENGVEVKDMNDAFQEELKHTIMANTGDLAMDIDPPKLTWGGVVDGTLTIEGITGQWGCISMEYVSHPSVLDVLVKLRGAYSETSTLPVTPVRNIKFDEFKISTPRKSTRLNHGTPVRTFTSEFDVPEFSNLPSTPKNELSHVKASVEIRGEFYRIYKAMCKHGFYHVDLSPANLLWTGKKFRVFDFGEVLTREVHKSQGLLDFYISALDTFVTQYCMYIPWNDSIRWEMLDIITATTEEYAADDGTKQEIHAIKSATMTDMRLA